MSPLALAVEAIATSSPTSRCNRLRAARFTMDMNTLAGDYGECERPAKRSHGRFSHHSSLLRETLHGCAVRSTRDPLERRSVTCGDASAFAPLRHYAHDAMRFAVDDDALVVQDNVVIVRISGDFIVSV